MRFSGRGRWSVTGVVAVVVAAGAASPALAGTNGGTWGTAQRVATPVTAQSGFGIGINSMSCSPKGYCAAVGYYQTAKGPFPYVVTESKGRWGKLKRFDLSALVQFVAPESSAGLVSCPSAGNCTVVGQYGDPNNAIVPFSVDERNGVWGKARPISHAQIGDLGAQISSFACSSTGNCVAGGEFLTDSHTGDFQPFVVSERGGVWGPIEELPGTSALSIVQGNVDSISCSTARTCVGVGSYLVGDDNSSVNRNFVAIAQNGVWGTATPVPGIPDNDGVGQIACSRDGTCTVIGSTETELFTITEKNGTWDTVKNKVPDRINGGLFSLACPSAGNCSADGEYSPPGKRFNLPVVAVERNGAWSQVQAVPGLLVLSHGKGFQASIANVACGAVGDCAATGWADVYVTATKVRSEAFVVDEVAGHWRFAQVVPGVVKLDRQGDSQGTTIDCWAAGHCAAGGFLELEHSSSPYPWVALEH